MIEYWLKADLHDAQYRAGEEKLRQMDLEGTSAQLDSQSPINQETQQELEEDSQPNPRRENPRSREVRAQQVGPQPYPDMGMAELPTDYTPLRNALIIAGVTLGISALLISSVANRDNSNSPTNNKPTPTPQPTITTQQVRSIEAYKRLVQAEQNPDGQLYTSFDVTSRLGANVRRSPSVFAASRPVGRLHYGAHIVGHSIRDYGDDPGTSDEETNAAPWIAERCIDLLNQLDPKVEENLSDINPKDMCFVDEELVNPHR